MALCWNLQQGRWIRWLEWCEDEIQSRGKLGCECWIGCSQEGIGGRKGRLFCHRCFGFALLAVIFWPTSAINNRQSIQKYHMLIYTLSQELLQLKKLGELDEHHFTWNSLILVYRLWNLCIIFLLCFRGPKVPFRLGREDADSGESSPKECGLPDADKGSSQNTRSHIRDVFYRE